MESLSPWQWLVALLVVFLFIFPLWKILARTGRPGWLALLVLVPLAGPVVLLAILWWLALGRWPAYDPPQRQ